MLNNSLKKVLRCGKCPGCQCEPCGTCIYCQDRPKFGGPNVRKKACIKRKCLRVLEKHFQRELPTFNARVGCNNCRDCKMLDCQKCLACLDKQFFDNHYIPGALCSRKLCNNASRLEIPSTSLSKDLSESRKEIKQECRLIGIEIDDLPGNLMPKWYKVEDQFEENPIETEEYEEEDPVETRRYYLSKKPVEEGTENEKPPYSYSALITMAIKDSPERRLHLSGIYKYIEERFPYYRHLNKKETWQNSIRHKLSVNDCFLMLGSNDKKGNYWTINAGYDDMFTNGNYKRKRKRRTQRLTRDISISEDSNASLLESGNSVTLNPPTRNGIRNRSINMTHPSTSTMEAGQVIYSNSTSSTNATVNVLHNEESSSLDDIGDEDLTQWFEELRTSKEEGSENEKPIYSYATLIAMAIRDSPQKRLTLAQIYKYIESRFPYYRNSNRKEGWQNSIRHNLSLDICFEMLSKDGKYGRNDRKRNYWTLAVDYDTIFKNGNFRRRRLTQLTKMKHSSSTTERLETHGNITNDWSYGAEIQTSQSPNAMNDLILNNNGIKCENCIEIQQELNELRSENEKLEREREIAYEHSEAIAKTLENSLEEIQKLKEENVRLKASIWTKSVKGPSQNKKKKLSTVPMTVVTVDNGDIQKNRYC